MKVDWVFIMLWSLPLVLLQVVDDPVPIRGYDEFYMVYKVQ